VPLGLTDWRPNVGRLATRGIRISGMGPQLKEGEAQTLLPLPPSPSGGYRVCTGPDFRKEKIKNQISRISLFSVPNCEEKDYNDSSY
jgi:hypothetical protein